MRSVRFALAVMAGVLVFALTAGVTFGQTPPFNQCPAIGADTSCSILIVVTPSGNTCVSDATQGPYDGSDDTLLGVQNNTTSPLCTLALSSPTVPIFGFESDGLCGAHTGPKPAGCPFGVTGYEGPQTSFTNSTNFSGTVIFTPCIPPGGSRYFSLEGAIPPTDCPLSPAPPAPSVLANKDFVNTTGTTVNDFEWLVQGSYSSVLSHYDGPYPGQANSTFSSFSITPSGPNTLLRWSGTASIPPGGKAHVGFKVPGTSLTTKSASWTIDGVFAGCAHQVSIGSGHSHVSGGSVVFENTATNCESMTLYAGNIRLEWFPTEVALAQLNATGVRNPIRVDMVDNPPVRVLSNSESSAVSIPLPPPEANFVMMQYTVSASPTLSDTGNTIDYIELPLSPIVPVMGGPGVVSLWVLLAAAGVFFVRRMSKAAV